MASVKIPPELVAPVLNAAVSVVTTWLKTRRRTRMVDEDEVREMCLDELEKSGVVLPPDIVAARALKKG